MGSSSSKPARRLGKETVSLQPLQATGVSRSAPPPPPNAFRGGAPQQRGPQYSEDKSQAIRQDAQDPQLMANLQKLGPVQVPRGKIKFRQSNEMLTILAARQKNQTEEDNSTNEGAQAQVIGSTAPERGQTNRLTIHSILQLLDERKACQTQRQIEELSVGFDVDRKVFDSLSRSVNSPSIEQGREEGAEERKRRTMAEVEADDDAPPRLHAVWTEPALKDVKELSG